MADALDVAIVGGGPAGAATAIRLARLGYRVSVFERHAEPRWRACGVFTSPLVAQRLAALGMDAETISDLYRPISSMDLESTSGASCRLEYRHGFACGFDRVRLDTELLERAAAARCHHPARNCRARCRPQLRTRRQARGDRLRARWRRCAGCRTVHDADRRGCRRPRLARRARCRSHHRTQLAGPLWSHFPSRGRASALRRATR